MIYGICLLILAAAAFLLIRGRKERELLSRRLADAEQTAKKLREEQENEMALAGSAEKETERMKAELFERAVTAHLYGQLIQQEADTASLREKSQILSEELAEITEILKKTGGE